MKKSSGASFDLIYFYGNIVWATTVVRWLLSGLEMQRFTGSRPTKTNLLYLKKLFPCESVVNRNFVTNL